jgi:hypothetical protein
LIEANYLTTYFINDRHLSFLSSKTESEIACEEAARLTAELQEAGDDDDDEINYNELPPPPGENFCEAF